MPNSLIYHKRAWLLDSLVTLVDNISCLNMENALSLCYIYYVVTRNLRLQFPNEYYQTLCLNTYIKRSL